MSKIHGETFNFRHLHPQILLGTASDRYAGWLGQIYSPDRYQGRVTKRTKIIGGKPFIEAVLPVDSVEEYFEHFSVLEIDFTFYRPLLDRKAQPTQNYQVLQTYARHLKDGDRVLLKVPEMVMAPKIHRGDRFMPNPDCLNPKIFTAQFYEPAINLLGAHLSGFIFEQAYQRKDDRIPVVEMALNLDKFFRQIPQDSRYHLELRTDLYLRDQVFEVMARYGVGQVLSHWTWLPPLRKQLAKGDGRFFHSGPEGVIRLLTPLHMRYEDSYVRAYPFDRLVAGMMAPEMVLETVEILQTAIEKGMRVNLIVNNRAGGNAPLIAQEINKKLFPDKTTKNKEQMRLW
jgi:uncharacterized protein YecE (DUF72 family)